MKTVHRPEARSWRRRAAVALAALSLAVSGAGLTGTSASADTGFTMLRSWPYGVCLDAGGGDAYSLGCNDGAYQKWLLKDDQSYGPGDGRRRYPLALENGVKLTYGPYQLINGATWRCLDSNFDGRVYTSSCDIGNDYQAWNEVVWDDQGLKHSFVNWKTGRVLQITPDGRVSTTPYPGFGHVKEWDFRRGY